jgi:hypothetical protein
MNEVRRETGRVFRAKQGISERKLNELQITVKTKA